MKEPVKYWDKIADKYDKTDKQFEQIHFKIIENTKKYLNVSDVVLDYGCATGTKAFELAGNVKKIQGIDLSSKMIENAKSKAVELNIDNVNFTHATIYDERYKRESFDVILAFNILHLVEDNRKAMRRIAELLKPDGLLISTTPCLKEKMAFLMKSKLYFYLLLIKLGLLPNMVKRFTFSELYDLIAIGNLEIIEAEKIFHWMSYCFYCSKKIETIE
ncbi:class I SAM-dependent methyltransferase [Candidatus Latescibacterota bacterium]